jgi:hypothetical protein
MIQIIRANNASYDPQRLSLLSMTRGRPENFLGLIESLEWVTTQPELTDIWCYLDDDDPTGQTLIDRVTERESKLAVHWVRGPRPIGLGQAYNLIAAEALKTSGLFLGLPDDYRIWSIGWDDMLRKAYGPGEDRLSLHYIPDPCSRPDQMTIFAGTREWVETVGYLLPEWFPYWFGDLWIDDVSTLAKVKKRLPVKVEARGGKGKTKRMWNLPFWWNFYDLTFLDRVEEILRVLRAKGDSPELEAEILARAEAFKITKCQNKLDLIQLVGTELDLTAEANPPSPLYLDAEKRASRHLVDLYARHPAIFGDTPPEDFDLEAAVQADENPAHTNPLAFGAVTGLFQGASLGAIAARHGVGPGRLLEWRNAMFLESWKVGP